MNILFPFSLSQQKWIGLRNASNHGPGAGSDYALEPDTWSSPLPVLRPGAEVRSAATTATAAATVTVPSPTTPMTPSTAGTSSQASAWTPVITSDFNSMQSTEPAFLLPLREGHSVSPPVALATEKVTTANSSRTNESLVDSSSNLRRSASKFADEFDAIVSSKSFAPAIKATSKELFREKEVYFDHESFQPSTGDVATPDQRDVSWDDKVEFPPSTTTTVALPRPARTGHSQEAKEVAKEVTIIDHNSNGKLKGATSSTWFTSSSVDKSDKLQTRGKTNVVKKSSRRIGQLTGGQEKERLVQSSTSAPVQQQEGPFVHSEDLRAAYEREISQIQSGAVSGERYEDLSDSFKVQPRKSIKSPKASATPSTVTTTTTTTTSSTTTGTRERLVKGSVKRLQTGSQVRKSQGTTTTPPSASRKQTSKAQAPSAEIKSTAKQVQLANQGKTSRVGKLKIEPKSQEQSENEQVSAPVKGGRVVKSNLDQSQQQEKVQREAKQDNWSNAKVTAYFNWAKSDSSAGQSSPLTTREETTSSPQSDRQTKGRAKAAISKTSPGQGARSQVATRVQESDDEDNVQDEPLDDEFERVTLSPIVSTSTTARPPARKQERQRGTKSARIVDPVNDLRRISPPTTQSPPRNADYESEPEEVSDLATTPSPVFRTTSRTLATTGATIQSSAGLKAAFDSAFKAAVTNEQSPGSGRTLPRQSSNNNDNQQKQVTSAKVITTKSSNNSNNRIKTSSKSSLVSGGKSSLSIETGNFAWSTDIDHTGNGKAEVKLITRKSGQLTPTFESDRITSEPEDDDSPDDDTFLLSTTPPPSLIATSAPKTTTSKSTTTSRRFVGGITRSPTTTAKPMTTASFFAFTDHQSTSLASTTSGPSSRLTASKGIGRSGEVKRPSPLLEELEDIDPRAGRKESTSGESNDGSDSNESSPKQGRSEEQNSSQFSKKSGIQYSSVVYESSLEREDGGSSGEQKEPTSGENGDDCRLEDAIPGTPLTDYPAYQSMPATSFKCSDVQYPGYYGDMEAQCQVFHVCQADGRKNDFLCPIGTIFNQELFVCDWWQNFRCADTPMFYSNNANLYFAKESVANNQLRKRTDAIEREGNDADDASDADGGDVFSEEIEGTDYSSREGSREEEETAVSRPPGPLTDAVVSGAVKGGRSNLSRQSESVKSALQGQSKGQRRTSVRARVSAAYGARLLPLEDSLDTLPLASNLARTTSGVEANLTTPLEVTTKATTATSTSTYAPTTDIINSPLTNDSSHRQPSETLPLPSSYSTSNSYSSADSAPLKLQSSPVATYISPLEPISSPASPSSPSSSRDLASTHQLVNLLVGQSGLNNG